MKKLTYFVLAGVLAAAGPALAQSGSTGTGTGSGMSGSSGGSMGGSSSGTMGGSSGGTMGGSSGQMEQPNSTMDQSSTNQQAFTDMDSNSDGNISRDEVQTDPQLSGQFQDLDSDQDGQLSSEEFSEYQQESQQMEY